MIRRSTFPEEPLDSKDRKLIQAAAQQIGMPMAAFIRTVAMQAAKQVLDNGTGLP